MYWLSYYMYIVLGRHFQKFFDSELIYRRFKEYRRESKLDFIDWRITWKKTSDTLSINNTALRSCIYLYMLAIAGQTARRNWLEFLRIPCVSSGYLYICFTWSETKSPNLSNARTQTSLDNNIKGTVSLISTGSNLIKI